MRLSFLPAPLVCGVARGFFVCLDIFGVCLQGWFHPKMLFLLLDVFDFEFLNPAFRRRSTLRCFFSLRVEHLLNFWSSPSAYFHPKKLFLLLDVFCLRRPSTLRCFSPLRVEHLLNFWSSPPGVFHPKMLFLLLDVFCLRRPSTLRSFSRFRVEPPPKFKAPAPGRVPPQDAFLAFGCIQPQAPFHPKKLFLSQGGTPLEFLK